MCYPINGIVGFRGTAASNGLKGQQMSAQDNALGIIGTPCVSKRTNGGNFTVINLLPFQGDVTFHSLPRALPGADISLAFQAVCSTHTSFTAHIANAMFMAGFIDKWGRGYKKIRDGFTAAGMPMPKVENFCGGVRVSVERTKFKEMTNGADVTDNSGGLSGGMQEHSSSNQAGREVTELVTKQVTKLVTKLNLSKETAQRYRDVLLFCESPKSSVEILAYLGITNQTKNRKKYVITLVENGALKMTLPTVATDPSQKYFLNKEDKA